jgi:hypothetical protein
LYASIWLLQIKIFILECEATPNHAINGRDIKHAVVFWYKWKALSNQIRQISVYWIVGNIMIKKKGYIWATQQIGRQSVQREKAYTPDFSFKVWNSEAKTPVPSKEPLAIVIVQNTFVVGSECSCASQVYPCHLSSHWHPFNIKLIGTPTATPLRMFWCGA